MIHKQWSSRQNFVYYMKRTFNIQTENFHHIKIILTRQKNMRPYIIIWDKGYIETQMGYDTKTTKHLAGFCALYEKDCTNTTYLLQKILQYTAVLVCYKFLAKVKGWEWGMWMWSKENMKRKHRDIGKHQVWNLRDSSGIAGPSRGGWLAHPKGQNEDKNEESWGNKNDGNLRKNEESETLAHPELWGWLRPCMTAI